MKFYVNGQDITPYVMDYSRATATHPQIAYKRFAKAMDGREFRAFSVSGPVILSKEFKNALHKMARADRLERRKQEHAKAFRRKLEWMCDMALARWYRRN